MGAYKPHPVWKPHEMRACPCCSAYVPKCLFEFHRCPPGSGVTRDLSAVYDALKTAVPYKSTVTPPTATPPVPAPLLHRDDVGRVLAVAIACIVVGFVVWSLGL